VKPLVTTVAATPLLVLLATLAACGSGSSAGSAGSASSAGGSSMKRQELTVYAASSLTTTFTELGRRFEASHRGVKVAFSFGGSSDLVAQIQQGAPADVFASADTATMEKAVSSNVVRGTPVRFATNTLEIAVPPGNPAGISSLKDLAKPGTKVVLCAPQVPCGAAAAKVEASSRVVIKPVSEEQAVTDVLTKVESGEADAGLVYVTDVKAAGDKVEGIPFPESSAAVNTYPVATLSRSGNTRLARQFVALVTGAEGRSVLAGAGFAKP
jgi:molybdate transport system substrate-binding protein